MSCALFVFIANCPNVQGATVYEAELVFRYGVDFDNVATTRLIASGPRSFLVNFSPLSFYCICDKQMQECYLLSDHSFSFVSINMTFLAVFYFIVTVRRSLHGICYSNSVRPSVRPSVCHTRGLCLHGSTYDHDFFTTG